ncbi:MAG: sugar transferase [Desulfobacteraceae bacterium]|nr:MAG: sugar transferase [Desulfobacteraceae bacterium]
MKRLMDMLFSASGLLIMSPVLLVCMLLIWLQDYHSPFYVAPRVGRNGKRFQMVKLRSMIVGADKTGVDSTSAADNRITWIGVIIRRYKLDEFSQLWNVLKGDMSLVGPRPNVEREVALYTQEERKVLDLRPGITDLASIVFSDEGDILEGSTDPDLMYNQVIRPWKSRLCLLYLEERSLILDMQIIFLTAVAIFSRSAALKRVRVLLEKLRADENLRTVARRDRPLKPYPPPGSDRVVVSRDPVTQFG